MRFSKHCWQCLMLVKLQGKARSSRPEMFCVFENFGNHKVFSCEFWEIFKNTFFHRTPPVVASEKLKLEAVVWRCSAKKLFLEEISLNSQENTCARVSFLQTKTCNFIKIESLTQVFSCEFCRHLSKNTFFYRTPPLAASVKACNFTKIRFTTGVFFWTF